MKIDAIIIGAGRSGTTTLYKYLENHKDVCFSSIKEIHYFSLEDLYNRGEKYYHSFWQHHNKEKVLLAADTYLLIDKKAPKRAAAYNPNMKIIVMLRNPAERTWSSFLYAKNNGYIPEKTTLEDAVNEEQRHIAHSDIRVQNNLCNLWQSMYFEHISYWLQFFPLKNFLFLQTSELKHNKEKLLSRLADFLEIEEFASNSDAIIANKSTGVKSKTLQQFLLNRNNPIRKLLRNILPPKAKQKILHSGISEKLLALNRKETEKIPLSEDKKKYLDKLLENDTRQLEEHFGISL